MNQTPPNVRYVEDSYAETWPLATQYASAQFGPVTEGAWVSLPVPPVLENMSVGGQWLWLQHPDNKAQAQNIMLTWHIRLSAERAQIHARCKAEVINRVNEAIGLSRLRAGAAVWRDPQTGRPV